MKSGIIKNIVLDKQHEETYAHVDGMSLQNLFFVKNQYFPSCFMFRTEPKYSDT